MRVGGAPGRRLSHSAVLLHMALVHAGLALLVGLVVAHRRRALRRSDSALSGGKDPFGPTPKQTPSPDSQRPAPQARYSSRHSS